MSNNQFTTFYLWTAITTSILSGPLPAQPIIPDEDIPNASDELRDLLYERAEVQEQLDGLEQEKKLLESRVKMLTELAQSQKEIEAIWEQLKKAETDGDKETAQGLQKQSQRLSQKIRFKRAVAEIDNRIHEYDSVFRETQEFAEEFEEAKKALELLEKGVGALRESRKVHERLQMIFQKGPKTEERSLEKELIALDRAADYNLTMFDLVREQFEASEEGEIERAEELEEEIEELRRSRRDELARKQNNEKAKPTVPDDSMMRQPIAITDAALEKYADVDFEKGVVPLLKTYCFECHSNETSSGELNIEALIHERPIVKNRDKWINILEQTKNRVMPTEDGDQPEEPEREKMVLALHHAIHNFDYTLVKHPGYELTRRLTHTEYDNTVRDLLGVDLRPASEFPTDLVGTSGFSNSANTLFVQPLLMERYMGAAELVVTAGFVEDPKTEQQRRAAKLVFIDRPKEASDEARAARVVLSHFLQRAYRRPVTKSEMERAIGQFSAAKSNGLAFHDAIKAIIRTSLVSPNFLLKNESLPSDDGDHQINDWELASRLSYFLWGSMPDDELFALAKQQKLSNPQQLKSQIDRMIADDRSSTLGTTFAAQWLGSQHLGTRTRLDPIDNPWCTETLMEAMRQETSMFFHYLLRENEPIGRLVDADFTFLNEELAKHYRISGVVGDEMQRVRLKSEDGRGGIFGHGSLLAVTSFPGRTSPVVRGRWILGDVLGTPPPPPPPNVSELPEEIEQNRGLTFRQKLEVHRRSPNCYACHSQMDPLGFALENYDWFGRRRDRAGRRRSGRAVDARGELPNGTEFEGLAGLKKVVVAQRMDDLIRQVSSKMLSYGLGRQLEYYDEPALRKIVAAVKADGNRFHTLLYEIVTSYPFQFKRVGRLSPLESSP